MKAKTILLCLCIFARMNVFAEDAKIKGVYFNFSGDNAIVTYKYNYKSYSGHHDSNMGIGWNILSNMSGIILYDMLKKKKLPAYTGDVIIPNIVNYNDKTYHVTRIGSHAFYKCRHLNSVTIPNGVTTIENLAFAGCKNLKSVRIPASVTHISSSSFKNCKSLTDVYYYGEQIPQTGNDTVFYNVNLSGTSLHVPSSAIEDYRKTVPWSQFGKIVALTDKDTIVEPKYSKKRGNVKTLVKDNLNLKDSLTVEGVRINLENFPDYFFYNWLLSQKYGNDGVLTDAEIEKITYIKVVDKNIKSLKGIEYFKALEQLYCSENQLSEIDVSKNIRLKILQCSGNLLFGIDVSKNTALKELDCNSNQLITLDLSNNTELELLWCQSNNLMAIDVTKNTALTELRCGGNMLTTLDISQNASLTRLFCEKNKLFTLDVSQNTSLTRLNCYLNRITDTAMDSLVNSLPHVTKGMMPVMFNDQSEQNKINAAQVAAVRSKGWQPLYFDGNKWVALKNK